MAFHDYVVEDLGRVRLYKKRSARSVRISLNGNTIKVILPHYVPYAAAKAFVNRKKQWILDNYIPRPVLSGSHNIGKYHTIQIANHDSARFKNQYNGHNVRINVPKQFALTSTEAQDKIHTVAQKILKKEAEEILPKRLKQLAAIHGFSYKGVAIKHLQSRWGSCDNRKNIVLNSYLMQLPWHYIDYVLLHELTHTIYLNHSTQFWKHLETVFPDTKSLRKSIKQYNVGIIEF